MSKSNYRDNLPIATKKHVAVGERLSRLQLLEANSTSDARTNQMLH